MRHGLALALGIALAVAGCGGSERAPQARVQPPAERAPAQDARALVEDLEKRTFDFFWETSRADNGLVPDRWPAKSFSSIAAVGFGLTAYGIGAERGWITRDQAIARTLATLRFFANAPQGPQAEGASGYRGFYYHFLDMDSGARSSRCELSTVDTAWLLSGALFAQSYFDRDDPREAEIRELAERLYAAADWPWTQVRKPLVTMGWTPEQGFHGYDWQGYNEALMVYVLALGSPTHPLGKDAYDAWTATYDRSWGEFEGQEYLSFPPLFGHQYSQAWIDFRGIRDGFMREHGLDYFENSRRAALAHRAYAIENPGGWKGYGADVWGLTASDGPIDAKIAIDGRLRKFQSYAPRGVGREYMLDDGTIAPTAAAASIAFAPEIAIPAIVAMHERYGKAIYGRYGFLDAFNPTLRATDAKLKEGRMDADVGWVDDDYLGIDQGPILLMIENHRSGLVWKTMRKNPHIRLGLQRAGFEGGWLDAPQ